MLRGLWRLAWLEIKIFVREPLGVIGTVVVPVLVFAVLGRLIVRQVAGDPNLPRFMSVDLAILGALVIAANAVLSLVTIIAIYREGGILKRLKATPLRPHTILTAHVLVKLVFTAATVIALVLAGRRYFPLGADGPLLSFTLGVMLATVSVLSLGFLIASVVPTARFAQPVASLILYPMLGISGLFAPLETLPAGVRMVARALPFTYAVSLLRGIWHGEGWLLHLGDAAVLVVMFLVFGLVSSRVFRWE
jgi:ABC-2 type transport system permease protein